jgi:DNA-binding XRE family transcriptional regulator/mannose-6-phosphate isomerase-like protein (cupin superfamily)
VARKKRELKQPVTGLHETGASNGSAPKGADKSSPVMGNELEIAIGREVRGFRKAMDLTVAQLAELSGFSIGMLSKIENGLSSPSLSTLRSLSEALNVPVTAFFRKYEEERVASFVPAGSGLVIERRGTRSGHQYQLLGHSASKGFALNPYLITLTEESEVFPLFQHSGQEFLYMLEGIVTYRHGDKTYELKPGDALLFDADAPHGPEELNQTPIRFLSILSYVRNSY